MGVPLQELPVEGVVRIDRETLAELARAMLGEEEQFSNDQLDQALAFLVSKGLATCVHGEDGEELFAITDYGDEVLKDIES